MFQQASLTHLFNLTAHYNMAFRQNIVTHPVLGRKFETSLTPEDHKTLIALQDTMLALWTSRDQEVFFFGQVYAVSSEELALAVIQLGEFVSSKALQAIDENELAALVPAKNCSAHASDTFAVIDAPTLAKLFAPKLF